MWASGRSETLLPCVSGQYYSTHQYLKEPPPGSFSLFFWFPESCMVTPAGLLPVWIAAGFPKAPGKRQHSIIMNLHTYFHHTSVTFHIILHKANEAYYRNIIFLTIKHIWAQKSHYCNVWIVFFNSKWVIYTVKIY